MTITYNHLNLPKLFTWTGGSFNGNSVEILYDAAGTKLKKTVKTGATVNYTQDYIGGIEYRDAVREAIYTAEGRIKYPTPSTTRYEYSIKDHLGNARISFSDLNGNGVVNETNVQSTNEVLQENHYYPFGLNTEGPWMNDATLDNKYQYNGKEINDDFGLNLNDYGARWYDASVGRWWVIDPLADKYFSISPFVYVFNRPNTAIDPDGKRVYFVGGAGNDSDNWNYIGRWGKAFEDAGIGFTRLNASHGKMGDVLFTASNRSSGFGQIFRYDNIGSRSPATGGVGPNDAPMIKSTKEYYKQDLEQNPLKEGEQFNLAGYSYGSVLQAQVALQLAAEGVEIDNLVLIGSPISDNSPLMRHLKESKNIKNIIRYDITDDLLSNPDDVLEFMQGGYQNRKDDGPHFNAARPSAEADKLINTIVQWLQQQGVQN